MNEPILFIPTLLSLHEAYHHLQARFGDIGVPYNLMLREILKDIFGQEPGKYGHAQQGVNGLFNITKPENYHLSELDISLIIHEAEVFVVDALSTVLPHLSENGDHHYFLCVDNHDVLIYVPVPAYSLTPELRLKAVPLEAVRASVAS